MAAVRSLLRAQRPAGSRWSRPVHSLVRANWAFALDLQEKWRICNACASALTICFCTSAGFPANFKYTSDHEWIESKEIAKVGISDFAQEELGDIVYVDLPEVSSPPALVGRCHSPNETLFSCGNFRISYVIVGGHGV